MSFDVPLFLRELREKGCSLGEPFTYLEQTDSTNNQAKIGIRNGAPHGATFLADAQTSGRGRRGRAWHAAPSEGLLISIVLRPPLAAHELSALALVVGLGVREALAEHAPQPLEIKWPNDVLVDLGEGATKKKLAGILVESEMAAARPTSVVVGVGINVAVTRFPEDLRDSAASLSDFSSEPLLLRREHLLAQLLGAVERWYGLFTSNGIAAIVPALNEYDALRGRRLRVTTSDGVSVTGLAAGIDSRGCLLLQTEKAVRAINAGTVEYAPT